MMLMVCVLWMWGAGGRADLAEHYGPLPSAVMHPEPTASGSLFGYSLLVRDGSQPEVIVGAPRARQVANPDLGRAGAVYRCALPLTIKRRLTNDTRQVWCQQIALDTEGNTNSSGPDSTIIEHYKDEMWLGASLAGGNHVNGRFIACAPRWANHLRLSETKSRHLVNGMCYALPASDRLADRQLLMPTAGRANQTVWDGHDNLPLAQYAEAGLVSHLSEDGRNLLLGAPGYAGWIGSVVHYDIWGAPDTLDRFTLLNAPNTYLNPPSTLANYGYFGYSVTSGAFAHNGGLLYVAGAPRADVAQESDPVPSVLVFDFPAHDGEPLSVRAALHSPQFGSYFGAALLALDADADGRSDLIVAAPLHADGAAHSVDTGRVYLYLNRPKGNGQLELMLSREASGQDVSGARFGTSLALLGDIDGDEFPEIAVGAPFEGGGAVYVYGARSMRLLQRVAAAAGSAPAFGMAVARSPDLDGNGCDELAVGSLGGAAVLRCRPALEVRARIQLAGHEKAQFCVDLPPSERFSAAQTDVSVEVGVVSDERRVSVPEPSYVQRVRPGEQYCAERTLIIAPRADLTRPVDLTMHISLTAGQDAAHALLAERSMLHATRRIVLEISRPELDLQLIPLSTVPFTLGTARSWSGSLVVQNTGDSAYGARVRLAVRGARVLRVPSACKFTASDIAANSLDCDLITPLRNGQKTRLPFELDVSELQSDAHEVRVSASALDEVSARPVALAVQLLSRAAFNLTGWSTPDEARQQPGAAVALLHHFQVVNEGLTQWRRVEVRMRMANTVRLLRAPCDEEETAGTLEGLQRCFVYNMSAGARAEFTLALETDHIVLDKLLNNLEEVEVVTTVEVIPEGGNRTRGQTATVMLRADGMPLWALFAALLTALLLLALLVYLLRKSGFFRRKERDELKKLRDQEHENKIDEEIVTEEVQDVPPN